jgi:hypothetical protein
MYLNTQTALSANFTKVKNEGKEREAGKGKGRAMRVKIITIITTEFLCRPVTSEKLRQHS